MDVWTAILTQFSCYVYANAEALRSLFVLYYDKELIARVRNLSEGKEGWGFVVKTLTEQMEDQIQQSIIDPELKQRIVPTFSTMSPVDKLVAGTLVMAAVKQYFTFTLMLPCAIPRVTLEGKRGDWVYILYMIEKLKWFGSQTAA